MEIRQATPSDASLIRALASEAYLQAYARLHTPEQNAVSFEEMYSVTSLQRQMGEQGCLFFLVRSNETDQGYMALRCEEPGQWIIDKLYLLPTAKGKGLGKELIEYAAEYIAHEEPGGFRLMVHVNVQNPALAFYTHLGFRIVGEGNLDIGHGRWIMRGYALQKEYSV